MNAPASPPPNVADARGIADQVAGLRATYRSGRTRPLAWRLSQLEAIGRLVSEREDELAEDYALYFNALRYGDIAPIPGTKRRRYLEENIQATELELSAEDLERIDDAAPAGAAAGDRYADMTPIGR